MTRVLFDGTSMQNSPEVKFHGGGEYAKFYLRKALECGYTFDVVLYSFLELDEKIRRLLADNPAIQVHTVNSQKELYDLADSGKYNYFYSALPYSYADYHGNAKLIGVVHGVRNIELNFDEFDYKYLPRSRKKERIKRFIKPLLPSLFWNREQKLFINMFEKLFKNSHIEFLTVSEHSKYSILHFFPFLDSSKIRVVYSPFEVAKKGVLSSEESDYFLMVSGNRVEKNVYRAMKAFDSLFSQGLLNNKIVKITGFTSPPPFFDEIKNKDQFILLPYVSSEELDSLFVNAFCFVYPSRNEGFGYPPLQAMAYGCPVIASSATSIPEACADAALYFSPLSIDDLCNRILQIYHRPELRGSLREKGYTRVNELQKIQDAQTKEILTYIFENDK